MPLLGRLWPNSQKEAESERVPEPRQGETVQLQTGRIDHVGLYRARVRAVGLRRLFLESAEAVGGPKGTGDGSEPAGLASAFAARMPLTLTFVRGDALYQCETRVLGPVRGGALVVSRPRQVTRIQRRHFYRLPLQSPTTFRVLGTDGLAVSAPQPGRLVNLSGGGALLASSKPVPGGVTVSLRVPVGKDGDSINVEGEVLDCHVVTQGLGRVFLVRVRFYGAPRVLEEDREGIVNFIYEQQRIMLRNRKLLRA